MSRTDAEILDRDEVNDLDAILALTNTDISESIHAVTDNAGCARSGVEPGLS